MCQINDSYIIDMKKTLEKLEKDFAVMNNNIQQQGNVINKLSQSFEKLAILIERTNENTRKIDVLTEKIDIIENECNKKITDMYFKGTKNCPLHQEKLLELEKRFDKIQSHFISALIFLAIQFIAIIVYVVEKHIG